MSESHLSSPEQHQARITADIHDVPFRTPVIADEHWRPPEKRSGSIDWSHATDYDNSERAARTDREWRLLSEIARRAIISDPEARHIAATFVDKPVNELLAGQAIAALAGQNDRIKAMTANSAKSVVSLLGLPAVPDEILGNSIRYARPLEEQGATRQLLEYYLERGDEESYAAAIQQVRENDNVRLGVSRSEKRLVGNRYSYGRDVKLLALMAELQDEPADFHKTEQHTLVAKLSSGTTLEMTEEAARTPQLLDPKAWQRRTKIKDRVYDIQVGGREAILKERKTNRHTDVLNSGYRDGLTSKQEFDLTYMLNRRGPIQSSEITLRWEKPLGCVEFPDGFQFAVFEKEPELDAPSPEASLKSEIQENPEVYKEEYARIKAEAKAIYHQRTDLISEYDREQETFKRPRGLAITRKARQQLKAYKKVLSEEPPVDELSFEEFATLKARSLMIQAEDLQASVVHELGYEPADVTDDRDEVRNGTFKVHTKPGERVKLELFGFDLEYYKPDKGEEAARRAQEGKENGSAAIKKIAQFDFSRGIARAASFAMMEDIGYKVPLEPTKAS